MSSNKNIGMEKGREVDVEPNMEPFQESNPIFFCLYCSKLLKISHKRFKCTAKDTKKYKRWIVQNLPSLYFYLMLKQ